MNSQRSCYTFEDPRDPRIPGRELPVENIFIGFRKVKKKKKEDVLEYESSLSQLCKYFECHVPGTKTLLRSSSRR